MDRYLQYVRQWPIYGCAFFHACQQVPPNGYFEHRFEHWLVGVSAENVVITDLDRNVPLPSLDADKE